MQGNTLRLLDTLYYSSSLLVLWSLSICLCHYEAAPNFIISKSASGPHGMVNIEPYDTSSYFIQKTHHYMYLDREKFTA